MNIKVSVYFSIKKPKQFYVKNKKGPLSINIKLVCFQTKTSLNRKKLLNNNLYVVSPFL